MKNFKNKKMPVIKDGEMQIEDSTFIIEYLKNQHGFDLDKELTNEQKAISRSFQWLCERSLAEVVIYFRWVKSENWLKFREIIFHGAPWIVKRTVANAMAKSVAQTLYKSGVGRFSDEERLLILKSDLKALSDFLGPRPYFFGERVSTLDVIAFSFLVQTESRGVVKEFEGLLGSFPNLKSFVDRFQLQYWPEVKCS